MIKEKQDELDEKNLKITQINQRNKKYVLVMRILLKNKLKS